MSEGSEVKELEKQLAQLHVLEGRFLGSSMRLRDNAGPFDPVAILAYAALKRSLFLVDGFIDMYRSRNLVCAGALLRIQLDTALRLGAIFLVDDPGEFALAVLKGTRVNALSDREGQTFTDRHLCDCAAQEFTWVTSIYEQASGFVHFSEKHIFFGQSAVQATPKSAIVSVNLTAFDDVSDSALVEAAVAFAKAAELVITYVARSADIAKGARAAV